MDLEFVDNKPFDKIKEQPDAFSLDKMLMNNSHLFILYRFKNQLRIFDLNTLDLVKKIDIKADNIKLVSTSHLILFDSEIRVIYLYNQSGDFEKLDQVDLKDELESSVYWYGMNRDTSPTISIYGKSGSKSISVNQLFNIHVK
jgi:hypothetical protein